MTNEVNSNEAANTDSKLAEARKAFIADIANVSGTGASIRTNVRAIAVLSGNPAMHIAECLTAAKKILTDAANALPKESRDAARKDALNTLAYAGKVAAKAAGLSGWFKWDPDHKAYRFKVNENAGVPVGTKKGGDAPTTDTAKPDAPAAAPVTLEAALATYAPEAVVRGGLAKLGGVTQALVVCEDTYGEDALVAAFIGRYQAQIAKVLVAMNAKRTKRTKPDAE